MQTLRHPDGDDTGDASIPRAPDESHAPPPLTLGARGRLLVFVLWTLFGLLQGSTWILGADGALPAWRFVAVALINAYLWVPLTPFILRLAARPAPAPGRRLRRYTALGAFGLLLAVTTSAAALAAHVALIPKPSAADAIPLRYRVEGMSRWFFEEVILFCVVFGAGLAIGVSRRYRERERESARFQARASQLEAERAVLQAQSAELNAQLAEARLAMLRTRLNPHFLFNTLNAVSALVAKDPRGVRDMIALLSELLRHALNESKGQEITLREELKLVRLYLEILEIRYQGQLQTVVEAGADVLDALVPNLILQPLVENAMKHGVDRAGGHGTIEVRVWRDDYDLVLSVRDTGPNDDPSARPRSTGSTGMGLQLTRDRLSELYGDEQTLELSPAPGGGTLARVTLPFHTRADLRAAAELEPS